MKPNESENMDEASIPSMAGVHLSGVTRKLCRLGWTQVSHGRIAAFLAWKGHCHTRESSAAAHRDRIRMLPKYTPIFRYPVRFQILNIRPESATYIV